MTSETLRKLLVAQAAVAALSVAAMNERSPQPAPEPKPEPKDRPARFYEDGMPS